MDAFTRLSMWCMRWLRFIFWGMMMAVTVGCVSFKPYERQFINDPEMQMGSDPCKGFQQYVQSIREGATPAGTAKASGGCGCN